MYKSSNFFVLSQSKFFDLLNIVGMTVHQKIKIRHTTTNNNQHTYYSYLLVPDKI